MRDDDKLAAQTTKQARRPRQGQRVTAFRRLLILEPASPVHSGALGPAEKLEWLSSMSLDDLYESV